MSDREEKNLSETQINAILDLSQNKNFANNLELVPNKPEGGIDVKINPLLVKKQKNWSKIGSFAAVIVFILSLFILDNPLSVSIFQQVSFFGLILVLFAGPLGRYTGTMWSWGHFGTRITAPSPSFLVRFIGWVLLLIPLIYQVFSNRF